MNTEHTELAEYIEQIGLKVDCMFIPISKSRNADKAEGKVTDLSINWLCTVSREQRPTFTIDYQQGIGHLPKALQYSPFERLTADMAKGIRLACEGERVVVPGKGIQRIKSPDKLDIIYCLVMDSDVLDAGGFEEWASDLGYDTDSRQAENTYKLCLEQSLKFKRLLSDVELDTLRELYQDH